jgi:hypothetical protein
MSCDHLYIEKCFDIHYDKSLSYRICSAVVCQKCGVVEGIGENFLNIIIRSAFQAGISARNVEILTGD